jgi:hypothetical protein
MIGLLPGALICTGRGTPSIHRALWFSICLVVCCTVANLLWLTHHILTIPPPWDAVIGIVDYMELTFGLPFLPPSLYAHPYVLISQEYPHYSWLRRKRPVASAVRWPISDILSVLADLTEAARVRGMANRGVNVRNLGRSIAIEEDVRRMYRMVLRCICSGLEGEDGPATPGSHRRFRC